MQEEILCCKQTVVTIVVTSFFLNVRCVTKPNRVVQSFYIPKQSFGAVRNRMQACMVLKLLPIFIAKPAAEHRAHRVSVKQSLLLPIFLNRVILVLTNKSRKKDEKLRMFYCMERTMMNSVFLANLFALSQ